ncbi:hypothetical protein CPB85DRAFT_585060 [Mucidula mucida]|nr:hypothetical protein CPB85DRAFT_585060 [Mucidula mucida]
MRQPGIIGRNTCVVEGTSDEWPGMDLVVKISWPPSSRVSENTFVEQIKAAVEAQEDAAWVLDHIPTILHSQDFHLQPDSPGSKLREYLSGPDVKFVDDKAFYYEHRVCRVSVHERLYRLDALKKREDYAQVIFDVFQVHRWIYDHPRIIHRDLSQGNIMWHKRRNRICGVLNDFDLSSSRDTIGASSKQRTGTRPFMAHELHRLGVNGKPPLTCTVMTSSHLLHHRSSCLCPHTPKGTQQRWLLSPRQ